MRLLLKWIVLSAWLLPAFSRAGDGAMEEVMQRMAEEMTRISHGLWREDYSTVAEAAGNLVKHPMPPLLERLALLAQLGSDATQFMKADQALQSAAMELKAAAKQRRLDEVTVRYQTVQQRCVDCHSWYRKRAATRNLDKDHD